MKKNDMILAAAISAAAGILCLLFYGKQSGGMGKAVVYREKEKLASYPLSEEVETELLGADGGKNLLLIRSGEVWIESADCPDGLCMKQGKISKSGQSIICLPHKLVITIEGGMEADVDAVAE